MSLEKISKTNLFRLGTSSTPYKQVVVQVYVGDVPFLHTGASNHPGVLFSFLEKMASADHPLVSKAKLGEFRIGAPDLEGDRYKVAGMGFADVYTETKRVELSGESATYGIGIDAEHLCKMFEVEDDWAFVLMEKPKP